MFTDEQYDKIWQLKTSKIIQNLDKKSPVVYEDKKGQTWYLAFGGNREEGDSIFMFSTLEAVSAYLDLMTRDENGVDANGNPIKDERVAELAARLNGYQIAFVNRDLTEIEEEEAFRAYARRKNISTSGKHRFPAALRLRRGRPMARLEDSDVDAFMELVDPLIGLAGLITSRAMSKLMPMGFSMAGKRTAETTARLSENGGTWSLAPCDRPHYKEPAMPAAGGENEISRVKLKKMRRAGTWHVRLFRHLTPMQWGDDAEDVLAEQLLVMDENGDYLPVQPVAFYETRGDVVLNRFMDRMIEEGSVPMKIRTDDETTYSFLRGFCERAGIQLVLDAKKNKDLDDLLARIYINTFAGPEDEDEAFAMGGWDPDEDWDPDENWDGDWDDEEEMSDEDVKEMLAQIDGVLDLMSGMTDSQIYQMPEHIKEAFVGLFITAMAMQEDVPVETFEKMENILDRINKVEKKHGKTIEDYFGDVLAKMGGMAGVDDLDKVVDFAEKKGKKKAKGKKSPKGPKK